MLYNLLSLEKAETILKVRDILKYMGYDDRMRLTCKFKQLSKEQSFRGFVQALKKTMDIGASISRRRWYLENFLYKDKIDRQKSFRHTKISGNKLVMVLVYVTMIFSSTNLKLYLIKMMLEICIG